MKNQSKMLSGIINFLIKSLRKGRGTSTNSIKILKEYGTGAGQPYVKHLDGEIWELRPLRDRVLFVAWHNGSYVLLHTFMKKTQKTPPREIEQAKRELADLIERGLDNEQ